MMMNDAKLIEIAMTTLETATSVAARDLKVGDVIAFGQLSRTTLTSVSLTKRGLVRTTDGAFGERILTPWTMVRVYKF